MSNEKLLNTVLFIGPIFPEPNSTAAGTRMVQLIKSFQPYCKSIHFWSLASQNDYSIGLEELEVKTKNIKINDSSFDEYLKQLNPDLVVFDRFMTEEQFGWRVKNILPDAIRVLDMEDVHAIRKSRERSVLGNYSWKPEEVNKEVISDRELSSIYRCDATIVISKYEENFLKEFWQIPDFLIFYFPLIFDQEKQKINEVSNRKNFVTIGNFLHAPNIDSVSYLKKSIWPLIRVSLPGVEMHIYGSYANQKAMQLNSKKEKFFIKGRADEVTETLLKYKVLLAPLRFGSGLKGKLFDASVANTPFLTSDIGSEGIFDGTHEYSKLNSPEEFAQAAVEVYQNTNKSNDLLKIQINNFKQNFGFNQHFDRFEKWLNELVSNINSIRNQNIIGKALYYNQNRSTEYFSRWIELKGKTKK